MEFNAGQIAEILNGEVHGEEGAVVSDFAKIENASKGTITFLSNPKYHEFLYTTQASIALVNSDFKPLKELPKTLTLIKVDNAYESLAKLLTVYNERQTSKEGVEEPVFIHPTAKIGQHVYIGAFSYIGANVVIEDNVKIHPQSHVGDETTIGEFSQLFSGVKLYNNTKIGQACVIHAGAVIGSDGFGFAPNQDDDYKKIPQIGNVIIEDFVEIGANSTIDRATIGSTIICKGVKLDNLIQIAHNVEIGENTVIAAQTGIAGSTKIGTNVMIGGQVGIAGHIKIANGTKVAGDSGIPSSITKENTTVQGPLAFPIGDFRRSYILFKNLPKLKKQVEQLAKQINQH
jgi:UDP-3-O-[3-hydroxymyristoyl] glucosamine N-acyltransferase